jgi:ribose transport system permease protein
MTMGETSTMNAADTEPAAGGAAAPPTRPAARGGESLLTRLKVDRLSAVYLLVLFFVIFGIARPDTFLTEATFKLVLSESVITAVLALAFLIPLLGGAFDLSIGSMMAFSLVIVNYLAVNASTPLWLNAIIALVACALVGAISGFIVVRLKVNSFIATLGTSQVLLAAVLLISKNQQIVGAFDDSYFRFGRDEVLGVPIIVFYLLVIALVLWYVLEHTPVGRFLFATGGNAEAARLSGVRTDRLVWGSLIASAVVAGIAGLIFSVKVGNFSSNVGPGYLFPAIAAVFFGASQFSRRPNVWGTLIALYALQFGVKGLQLTFQAGTYWIQPLFEGLTLIIAVALASRQGIVRLRRAKDEPADEAKPPASQGATA